MKKLITLVAGAFAGLAMMVSCNSSDYVEGAATSYGVGIKSFNILANDSVLEHLDSVFFSINMPTAKIFNADSLPYGTVTAKLVPSITTVDYVSILQLMEPRVNQADSIHDYLTNPGDTIDFSNGPVKMRVVSYDGLCEMTYEIKVNVHQIQADSLVWDRAARRSLPGTLPSPAQQKTTEAHGCLYVLTRAASSYSIAYSTDPYDYDSWTAADAVLPADAQVNSFTAVGSDLYILAGAAGSAKAYPLYKSSDKGATWEAVGTDLTYIYGAANDRLLANRKEADGSYVLVDLASGSVTAVPDGMPVDATSNLVTYSVPMAEGEIAVIAGGLDAAGNDVAAVWSYDGRNWASVNNKAISWIGRRAILVPFVNFLIGSNFVATEYPSLLVFGGQASDGTVQRTVYTSPDYGFSWTKAPDLMQLPEAMPSLYNAQAYVFTTTLSDEAAADSRWESMALNYRIPGTATLEPFGGVVSRAVRPITQWECPYIYLFGGIQNTGNLSPFVWRATFNRLTFKPLQ